MNEGMNSLHFGELRRVSIQEIIERRRIRRSRSRERERERERTKRKISHDRDSRENREEEQKKERTEFFNNINNNVPTPSVMVTCVINVKISRVSVRVRVA